MFSLQLSLGLLINVQVSGQVCDSLQEILWLRERSIYLGFKHIQKLEGAIRNGIVILVM